MVLYTASPVPLYPHEILDSAISNQCGFMTGYQNFSFLEKATQILRPTNVPRKPKWLIDNSKGYKIAQSSIDFVAYRVLTHFQLTNTPVSHVLSCVISVCKPHVTSTYEVAALFLIAVKIVFGLRDDTKSEGILIHIAKCLKEIESNKPATVLWGTQDINRI